MQMRFTSPFFVVLLTLLVTSAVHAAPDPAPGKGLYFINLASDAQGTETYFRYELRSAGAPAITKVVLHTCTARLLRVIVESSDDVKIATETNGILRIETANMADYETKVITLVMRGVGWSARPATYDLMADQTTLTNKETHGPLCAPNSVALTHLSATPSVPGWMRSLLAPFIRN
jgi:hypothetical protein